MRPSGREVDQIRKLNIELSYLDHVPGSVLISMGLQRYYVLRVSRLQCLVFSEEPGKDG